MKNLTVTMKLCSLVASAILGLISLFGLEYYQINRVYTAANYNTINTLPSVILLNAITTELANVRAQVWQHMAETEKVGMDVIEQKIDTERAKIDKLLKDYEPLISNDEDKQLLEADKAGLNNYDKVRITVRELSRANKNTEARDLLMANQEMIAKTVGNFTNHTEFNTRLGKKSSDEAAETLSSAITVSIMIVLLTMAIIGALGVFIGRNLMSQLGGEPELAADIANKIAKGDLSSNIVVKAGDTGSVLAAMKEMSNTIKMLLDEMEHMSIEHEKGDIDVLVDTKKFQGNFQAMAQGINDMVFGHIAVKKKAMACVKEFGQGNLDAPLEKFPGKKVFINDTIEQLRGNLKQIVGEIRDIVALANKGDFNTKIHLDGKTGFTKELSELLNQLSDTVDIAFKDTIRVAQALAQGDLSQKVSRDYQGAFDQVKQSVNTTVDSLTGIVNEIRNIVALANKGDFSTKISLNGKMGYTKELSELLNQLSDTVDTAFKDTIQVSKALENGDLTQSVTREYQGAFDQVKQSLNNTVEKLSQVISEVNAAAVNIASASEQVSATAQNMSQATSEQAASVEETSSSIEQMSASINQNTENAKVTDGMASKASNEAIQGGSAVQETVNAMKSIAGKIGIIDDIAYQTNLLALNAAIEAARAGEHGKGFAVVAAEVRKLAERSQVAAQEIGELAESSVGRAETAGKLLDTIVPSIKKTSDLVQEITAASEEQSAGVNQINVAMNQLNQITQQNAASSEELAATSEEMSSQAAQLQELISFFKVESASHSSVKHTQTKPFVKKSPISIAKHVDESDFVHF